MQAFFARELITKCLIPKKIAFLNVCSKIMFKCYFIRVYSLNLKENILKTPFPFFIRQ
jgi:hypothetical protein